MNSKKKLYVDITIFHKKDFNTGIQRVVKSIIKYLLNLISNYEVNLVYLSNSNEDYIHAVQLENQIFNIKTKKLNDYVIKPNSGDLFLGLDLVYLISTANGNKLFQRYKNFGVKIIFVVYDLLPIFNQKWWPSENVEKHKNWINSVLNISDGIICISKTVLLDVKKYIEIINHPKKNEISLDYIHLGADINNSITSNGLPSDYNEIISKCKDNITFLMVGTIEPRKGHIQTLKAFEYLWENGFNINLVIVGKKGWFMDEFISRLLNHKKLDKKLFWIESPSDEYLEKIYQSSKCLIAASENEGFGLPLIEAAKHKLPIIARDIPVFKEILSDNAYYFQNTNDYLFLSKEVEKWIELFNLDKHSKSELINFLSWEECTKKLLHIMQK